MLGIRIIAVGVLGLGAACLWAPDELLSAAVAGCLALILIGIVGVIDEARRGP